LVQVDSILNLKKRLSMQKNIEVKFESIVNSNHFYKGKEKELSNTIESYIKDKITII
jgi:alpha/beta superfamily hydrolase